MKDKPSVYRLYVPQLLAESAVKDSQGVSAPGGPLVSLPQGEVHHALHVLRLRQGDQVELFDGAGGTALGRIARAGRSEMEVAVEELRPRRQRQGPTVHLCFAVPKGNRLDWLLEKATELGVASLVPTIFARSVAGGDDLSENKRRRWLGHCISAAKQSGLDYLPAIDEPLGLSAVIERFRGNFGLVGDPSGIALSVPEVFAVHPGGELFLVVGPEGGLTDDETQLLCRAGIMPCRVGHTTLRTETAAIALLSAVMAVWP